MTHAGIMRGKRGERFRSVTQTVSIGASSYRHGIKEEDIIRQADNALYAAKQKGRNRVEVTDV